MLGSEPGGNYLRGYLHGDSMEVTHIWCSAMVRLFNLCAELTEADSEKFQK